MLIYYTNKPNLMADPKALNPRERTILATRFFKLLCEKNSDAERTGLSTAFVKDDVCGTNDLNGINKEAIMPPIVNHLKKLDHIIEHADGKISITNLGKKH
jgi:hypothetical protein